MIQNSLKLFKKLWRDPVDMGHFVTVIQNVWKIDAQLHFYNSS